MSSTLFLLREELLNSSRYRLRSFLPISVRSHIFCWPPSESESKPDNLVILDCHSVSSSRPFCSGFLLFGKISRLLKLNLDIESRSPPLNSPSPTLSLDLRLSMKTSEVRLVSFETFLELVVLLALFLIVGGTIDPFVSLRISGLFSPVSALKHKVNREYRKKYETNCSIFNHELEIETSSN